jgi:hypothetical protein
MAVSTCMKCGGHSFELVPFTPLGEQCKLTLVQCAACGAAIGALDALSRPSVEGLQRQIASIDARLAQIAKALTD